MHLRIRDNNGDVFDDVLEQAHQFFMATAEWPTSIGITSNQKCRVLLADTIRCHFFTTDKTKMILTTLLGFPVIIDDRQ